MFWQINLQKLDIGHVYKRIQTSRINIAFIDIFKAGLGKPLDIISKVGEREAS